MSGRGDDRVEAEVMTYSPDLSDRVHDGVRRALDRPITKDDLGAKLFTANKRMETLTERINYAIEKTPGWNCSIEAIRELTIEIRALREALAPAPIKAKRVSAPKKENEGLFQTVVGDWNASASRYGFPQVADITDRRQSLILARSEDLAKVFDIGIASAGFSALFSKVRSSPFLRGENKIGFKADFDWVLNKSNFTKIMEGKYDAPKETGKFGPPGRSR